MFKASMMACFAVTSTYKYLVNANLHDKTIESLRGSQSLAKPFKEGTVIASGSGNRPLASEIASLLGCQLADIRMKRFNDGECQIEVHENLKGKTVYLIQPTCAPTNDNLVEFLLTISTLKRCGATVIGVCPYYGYARQDRPAPPHNPGIYSSDVAHMMESMGLDKIITLDLHSTQTLGAFRAGSSGENIDGGRIGVDYILGNAKELGIEQPVVVSPDAGGFNRAKKFTETLRSAGGMWDSVRSAMLVKHRSKPGEIDDSFLIGKVEGADCIVVDDMIDTGGTILAAAKELKEHGAKRVYIFATHGLFNGKFVENAQKSGVQKIIVTNSLPGKETEKEVSIIQRISAAPFLAEAIYLDSKNLPMTELYSRW